MKTTISSTSVNQKININDVVIPEILKSLYDYSNREDEIKALMGVSLLSVNNNLSY